jgi:hypothetical protein
MRVYIYVMYIYIDIMYKCVYIYVYMVHIYICIHVIQTRPDHMKIGNPTMHL